MAPESPSAGSMKRPRTSLLVLLGVALAVFVAARMWSGNPSRPAQGPSNPRAQGSTAREEVIDPAELDVRLEALNRDGTDTVTTERNPFVFKPPPPPPPPPPKPFTTRPVGEPDPDAPPPGPPEPPRIEEKLKFIGIVEPKPGDRVAAFSDCRMTFYGRPGDIVAGQYKLVQIGIESVTMEYPDGRGRTNMRMSGQECVNK